MSTDERSREIQDRVRRIETRLTKLMGHLGFDPQGSMPTWDQTNRCVEVPSISTAFKDIMAVVPENFPSYTAFRVEHKGETLAFITKGK